MTRHWDTGWACAPTSHTQTPGLGDWCILASGYGHGHGRRLPDSWDHMLAFNYRACGMPSLLCEAVFAFEAP